jgi:hypothetical protein
VNTKITKPAPPAGLFQVDSKILVAERRMVRHFNTVKCMLRGLVTAVAGIGHQQETTFKLHRIFCADGFADTVNGGAYHAQFLYFAPVGAV